MNLPRQLYQLQQIDLEFHKQQEILDEIKRKLGESESLLAARAKFLSDEPHLKEVEKRQRDAEWEVEDLENHIAQLSDKLYGGKIKNPKELVSLEHEIKSLKSSLRAKEDELLDIMAEVEASRDRLKLSSQQLRKVEQEWKEEQEVLSQKQTEVEAQLAALSQRRQLITSQIDSSALELYEEIRLRREQAVAKVEQGRCQGCRITLPVSEWQRTRTGALVRCSSCGRILYLD